MKQFGDVLKSCRVTRDLSLRELGKLTGIDHSYIHRLESNNNLRPSDEVFTTLMRTLKVTQRMRDILNALRTIDAVPTPVFDAMFVKETRSISAFETAAKMSFRGERPTTVDEWGQILDDLDEKYFQQ